MQGNEPKRYMDVQELSEYLGVSRWMIYKYIEGRDIPFIPFGRIIRFDRLAIDRWVEKRTVRSAAGSTVRPVIVPGENDWLAPCSCYGVQGETGNMEAPNGNL